MPGAIQGCFAQGRLGTLVAEHVLSAVEAPVLLPHVLLDGLEIVIPVQRRVLLLQSVGPGAGRKLRIALRDPDLEAILDSGLLNALRAGTGAQTHECARCDEYLAHVPSPRYVTGKP